MSEGLNPTGHVFISYDRHDAAYVDRLQQLLEAAGTPVWRDQHDLWPGDDWRRRIRQAITDDALVFLACFSQASVSRSRSIQNEELTLAIEQMRLRGADEPWLIPVRFDDCTIPDRDLGGGRTLAAVQRADLFGSQRPQHEQRLVVAIRRLLRQPPAAAADSLRDQVRRSSEMAAEAPADKSEPGLRAIVISAEADAGFAADLAGALRGLRVQIPLAAVLEKTLVSLDGFSRDADPDVCCADVALIVVSRDLLATEFGVSEDMHLLLQKHDEREALVLPVVFRPAFWERQPFGRLAALPSGGPPITEWRSYDEAIAAVTDSLQAAISEFWQTRGARSDALDTRSVRTRRIREIRELGEVFQYSGVPGLTFVEPKNFMKFRLALRQPGLGIVLEGPSGIGKTTILRHAVAQDRHRLGKVTVLSARKPEDLTQISRLPDGHEGLVAVDDFHRLPATAQDRLADYLKRLADADADVTAKLIVVGIPGTAQNLVSLGSDLATRISVFHPDRAADELVLQMIEKGETALNIVFDAKRDIVARSVGSLQTAQMLCWHLVAMAGIEETLSRTATVPTNVHLAQASVTEDLRLKYHEVVDQFAVLDEPEESLCIDLLLELANSADGILRLDNICAAHPVLKETVRRIFLDGLPTGFGGDKAKIAEHLYYDPRGRRLIADDPQFIFYLRQLTREQLLEAAGKSLPVARDQVFICYSHQDAKWLDRVVVHLTPLEREGIVDSWSDRRLAFGDQWHQEIEAALARARSALLLTSADFMASDFINRVELPRLLDAADKGGCRVIPIHIRPSSFMEVPELARFQAANSPGRTLSEMTADQSERVLDEVARSLRSLFTPDSAPAV